MSTVPALVEPEWLASHLGRVTVLDATWNFPSSGRDADAEFENGRIPGK